MRPRSIFAALCSLLLVLTVPAGRVVVAQQKAPARPQWPGSLGQGVTLLPNGWTLAPAGQHMTLGPLPLAMVQSPDGRYLIVSNDGGSRPSLTVVDLKTFQVKQTANVDFAWLGLAWHPTERRLYSSAGAQNAINELSFARDRLTVGGAYPLGRPQSVATEHSFVGGVAVSPDANWLYAAEVLGKALAVVDLKKGRVRQTIDLPAEAYTVLPSPDGKILYVSLWGGAKVLLFDAVTLAAAGEVVVGEHPNAMVLSKDGGRLFVACANTNAVWVVDTASRVAREQISVSLFPNAPAGSTPNALDLSADGHTLLVANADNNAVAVVDVSKPDASLVQGFIPTGWYPTAVMFDRRDGRQIFILSGKGLTSSANPRGPQPGAGYAEGQYSGSMLAGALSVVPTPDAATLKTLTRRVYDNTPYSDAVKLAPAGVPAGSPIPRKVGDASPIKYVFYVIRENRTYDQVLGDLEKGNGDPSLAILGEQVTPNAHALAREFVLFDNFYVNAEVSFDGHAFSMGAYATDIVQKMWPPNYSGKGGLYLTEGGWETRTKYGNISAPAEGWLWDFATRAGVSVRSYGEFGDWEKPGQTVKAQAPGLEGLMHPSYPPWDLSVPDTQRADIWLKEFREFEASGNLPRLSIIKLPNDHTSGTSPGAFTPRSMVADNDLALGRIVEAITKSRYWKESAIFVLEDDAQNGPDHVDCHRSPAFVISPFVKRQSVDSTMYSTVGMLRTMELILGLPPMSQYDAAATPMFNAFQATAVLTGYTVRPARVPIDERNDPRAPGAQASLAMDFSEVDRAPELELNEIIWKSIRGANAMMPPPRRAAFVRSIENGEREEKKDEK
jgi:DNA-binding beta-propeller fold protein YncE